MKQDIEWATDKQKEGIEKFQEVVDEYGFSFDVAFSDSDSSDESGSRFDVIVEFNGEKYKLDIAFDYEQTWAASGERIYEWQFLFSGGESVRELSAEIFFVELFNQANRKIENAKKEAENLRENATNWIALMACHRIRVVGSAGIGIHAKTDKYAHIGLELWTRYGDCESDEKSREWFMEFMEKARQLLKDGVEGN